MKDVAVIFGLIFILFSCGHNPDEMKLREQFVIDSIQSHVKRETEVKDSILKTKSELEELNEQTAKREAEQLRLHQEKMEVGKSIKMTKLKNLLDNLEEKISSEEEELSRINAFQIGRSAATKSAQIQEQREVLRKLEKFKEAIQFEISHTHLHQSFQFQMTPEGTVNHLAEGARSGDYSKFRYLIDPYGEFDQDVFTMCLIERYPEELKEQWKNKLEKLRVIGTPVIQGEKAEVEVAVGPSSSSLETIHLVKRMDHWYLQSI